MDSSSTARHAVCYLRFSVFGLRSMNCFALFSLSLLFICLLKYFLSESTVITLRFDQRERNNIPNLILPAQYYLFSMIYFVRGIVLLLLKRFISPMGSTIKHFKSMVFRSTYIGTSSAQHTASTQHTAHSTLTAHRHSTNHKLMSKCKRS